MAKRKVATAARPTASVPRADQYGPGFSAGNLARLIRYAGVYPEDQIIATLSQQLNGSHFGAVFRFQQPFVCAVS